MLIIRPANSLDRESIMQVNRLSWQQAYKSIFTEEEVQQLFKGEIKQQGSWLGRRNERLIAFVAEENSKVIGFIGMASLLNDTAAEITTFYLLPDEQGKGTGKLLWDAALRKLAKEGYTGVWVWVLAKAKAVSFYEGRGCIEKERGVYSVGSHAEETIGYFLEFEETE